VDPAWRSLVDSAVEGLDRVRRLLALGGRYVMVGGATKRIAQMLVFGAREAATRNGRHMGLLVRLQNLDLDRLAALAADRTIVSVIGETFELADVAQALRLLVDGRALGKIVVEVD
jgi:NADPH:quinone reductase-like Zn-dependent oxidoreductase